MKGFTLIELLVVVFIIGLLSAVALPQYTKAVDKNRFSVMWDIVRAIRQAEDVYYMANGTYTCDASALDIGIPAGNSLLVSQGEAEENCSFTYQFGKYGCLSISVGIGGAGRVYVQDSRLSAFAMSFF